jgi:hypothetical protein
MPEDYLAAPADLRARIAELTAERDDARSWARHGYEIGQRTCTWADEGVAPKWLTEGHRPEALQPTEAERRWFELDERRGELIALIKDLADPAPCEQFDHHGYCQTHGWLTDESRCPHARATELLTEVDRA